MPSAACRASSVVFRAIATDSLAAASQLLADVQRFGLQMVEFRKQIHHLIARGHAIRRFSAPASHDIPLSVRSRLSDDRRSKRRARRHERPAVHLARYRAAAALGRDISLRRQWPGSDADRR